MLFVSVLIVVLFFTGSDPDNVDPLFFWTYSLLGLSIATAVLLPTINLAQNPKGALRSIMGVVVVLVVLAIAYGMSDGTPVVTATDTYDNVAELRLSDTGLYTTYIALGAAFFSIIALEAYNMFK